MESNYDCEICSETFDNMFVYLDHLSKYMEDNLSDKDKSYVKKSMMNMKRNSAKCPICDSKIGSYYYYLQHKESKCKFNPVKIKNILANYNKTELDDIAKFIANLQTQSTTKTIVTGSSKIGQAPAPGPVDLSKNVTKLKVKDDLINDEKPVVISKIIMNNLRDPNMNMLSADNVDESIVDIYEDLMEQDHYDYSVNNIEKVLLSFYKTIYFNEEYPENHIIYVPDEGTIWTFENEWINNSNLSVKLSEIVEDVKVATKKWIREVVKYRIKEYNENSNSNQIMDKFERLKILDNEIDHFPNDDHVILDNFFDIAYSFNSMVKTTYNITSQQKKPKIIRLPKKSIKSLTTPSS
ncbi:MAG: hypothetical protein WD512_20045 [Candidatus Paceibacterota bacterium]